MDSKQIEKLTFLAEMSAIPEVQARLDAARKQSQANQISAIQDHNDAVVGFVANKMSQDPRLPNDLRQVLKTGAQILSQH